MAYRKIARTFADPLSVKYEVNVCKDGEKIARFWGRDGKSLGDRLIEELSHVCVMNAEDLERYFEVHADGTQITVIMK